MLKLHHAAAMFVMMTGAWAQQPADSSPSSTVASGAVRTDPSTTTGSAARSISEELPRGKVSLVRGVLRRVDPVHDELLIRAFGGGDVRIGFDPRTELVTANEHARFTKLPLGSVVSVDAVTEGGRLFALAVRPGSPGASEANGRVVRYDAAKALLILRDAMSPENISLKIPANVIVTNKGRAASVQSLAAGTLITAWFSPDKAVTRIEVLAEPGESFTFEGRVVSVDLRSRVLALSNNSDKTVRELAIDSLDTASLNLLREDANVRVQAVFDGDRYKIQTVTTSVVSP